jgi:hypothetical protein
MPGLQDLKLFVPVVDSAAWDTALEEAPADEKPFIRRQAQLCTLLDRVRNTDASPEVIGWLSLWSRCFGICDAARGAFLRQTTIGLGFLERPAYELALQTECIFEGNSLIDRLRAYVAWCLAADRDYLTTLANPDHLARAYDQLPTRTLLNSLKSADPKTAALFGDIEELSDQEADFDRDQTLRKTQTKIQLINEWMSDARLTPWTTRIDTLRDRKRSKNAIEFYALFNETESSVYKRLTDPNGKNARYAYLAFSRGSAILHGSTLDRSLRLNANGVAPLIGADDRELAAVGDRVLEWVDWVGLVLQLIESPFGHAR